MDEMRKLVRELECATVPKEQIRILQEIGKALLTEYVIRVGGITIKPLWVEAYYHAPDNGFKDASVHGDPHQKKFDVLYFHHKTDDQRSGVDICLSCGDYCLSFLLKYTLVDGIFKTQAQLSAMIPKELRDEEGVLVKEANPAEMVLFTKRINITSGGHENDDLAMVRDVHKRFITESGEKCSLPQKTELLKSYIAATYSDEELRTEEQRIAISRKLVGEYWHDLFE